jgi:hypothetical protein
MGKAGGNCYYTAWREVDVLFHNVIFRAAADHEEIATGSDRDYGAALGQHAGVAFAVADVGGEPEIQGLIWWFADEGQLYWKGRRGWGFCFAYGHANIA